MRFERTSDRVVIGGIIGIIALSPFAFGSVYRAAFTTLEAVSFALFAVCMIKRSRETSPAPPIPNGLRLAALPGMVLLAVIAGQLIPLPPHVMRAITPATYQLNRMSFPGWPALAPYQGIAILGSSSSANCGVREKSAPGMASASQWEKIAHAGVSRWRWRAVAIAPTVVASGLIEWLALGAIFVTITVYPFGLIGEREPERGLYRAVILSILLTGSADAIVGLLQRAWWNGKLLWFWAPQDWGGPLLAQAPRASGPFVDPDHFANYLAMVLPLAIMASLVPLKIVQ
jgi:hypothetical protein